MKQHAAARILIKWRKLQSVMQQCNRAVLTSLSQPNLRQTSESLKAVCSSL